VGPAEGVALLVLKQPIEVVARHRPILAAVLEQESGQGRLHQPVLIPLGMAADEPTHGIEEILRKLVFNADVTGGVGRYLIHSRKAMPIHQATVHRRRQRGLPSGNPDLSYMENSALMRCLERSMEREAPGEARGLPVVNDFGTFPGIPPRSIARTDPRAAEAVENVERRWGKVSLPVE
jgi:hypothetical protein